MNDRPAPHPSEGPATIDDALRLRLRKALQPRASAVDALSARVLAQWHEQQGEPVVDTTGVGGSGGSGAATLLALRASRRRVWAGVSSGLFACALFATIVWLQRPDPVLEELLQTDVLSQMAIDEM
mgnify:CR=1 FL=1